MIPAIYRLVFIRLVWAKSSGGSVEEVPDGTLARSG
jgi:hypothetical protein